MTPLFDHEKLEVYRESLRLIAWLEPLLQKLTKSISALDVLVAKTLCDVDEVLPGKDRLRGIVSMLVGLIRANSDYRLHEGDGEGE